MKIISCEEAIDSVLKLTTSADSIYHDLTGEGQFGFRMACQNMIDKLSDMDSLIGENLLMQISKEDNPNLFEITYRLTYDELLMSSDDIDISHYILKLFQSILVNEKLKYKGVG